MNYGRKLKDIRTSELLTQQQIADILAISRSTYKDYELQIRIIPIKHLVYICDIFNVSVDYIFDLISFKNYDNSKEYLNKHLFTERFKNFRKQNKLTQEQIAKTLNTAHSVISDYEHGKKIITTPFLYGICQKYHVSADYLLGKIDFNPLQKIE